MVEDPSISLLAELPSGHTDLKSYRATNALISDYSLEWKLEGGDTKDYSKAPDCTRAEVHALKLWATNEIYPEVNRALRTMQEGKLEGNPLASKVEREILMIASGINCAPQYRGPVVRMENTPALLLAQYEPGNYLGMRAFTSTTKGTNPSAYFLERNLQEIFIPEASGADIDVLEITAWPEEKEVLIRPGTVFRVTSRTHYPGKKPSHLFFFEQF